MSCCGSHSCGGDHTEESNSGIFVVTNVSQHIFSDRSLFKSIETFEKPREVVLGNDGKVNAEGSGTVVLSLACGSELTLDNCLYAPDSEKSFVSMAQAMKDSGINFLLGGDGIYISPDDKKLGSIADNGLFVVDLA